MRFANIDSRASLVVHADDRGGVAIDLHEASNARLPVDPMAALTEWVQLREFVESQPVDAVPHDVEVTSARVAKGSPYRRFAWSDLRAPSPRPRQIFGIGLNYREHALETGTPIPQTPLTFTKFASSINDPFGDIRIDVPTADWEIELVVVIAAGGRNIPKSEAWSRTAGVTIGQDISDRVLQRATQPPQFSLGKSRAGYAPIGPWIVDASSMSSPDSLNINCRINDIQVQNSTTSDMIFSVPDLIVYLSSIVELYPGDLIFTGTPSGVGAARTPPIFLAPGDLIESTIEGIGSIRNRCV